MKQDAAVLILSHDGNHDMWKPFFQFFRKFWTDCPFSVYLITNNLDPKIPGVKVIQTGNPSDWSTEIDKALDYIPEETLIVLLEDYFIIEKVDNQWINNAMVAMKKTGAGFVRLGTFPSSYNRLWPSTPIADFPGFNRIHPEAEYLVNLQTGIWEKRILKAIIKKGESPWQFEIEASKRFALAGHDAIGLYPLKGRKDVHGPIVYLCGALTRGVLMRDAVRLAKKEGIELEMGQRKVETRQEEMKRKFYIALPLPLRKVYSWISTKLT